MEIWQTIRLACESGSKETAQAIIDSANITVPTGKLSDGCYDEWGNQYIIPKHCLVEPSNLEESSLPTLSPATLSPKQSVKKEHSKNMSHPTDAVESPLVSPVQELEESAEFALTVRTSLGKDVILQVSGQTTMAQVLVMLIEKLPELNGKKMIPILFGQRLDEAICISDTKLTRKVVMQVMVQSNI